MVLLAELSRLLGADHGVVDAVIFGCGLALVWCSDWVTGIVRETYCMCSRVCICSFRVLLLQRILHPLVCPLIPAPILTYNPRGCLLPCSVVSLLSRETRPACDTKSTRLQGIPLTFPILLLEQRGVALMITARSIIPSGISNCRFEVARLLRTERSFLPLARFQATCAVMHLLTHGALLPTCRISPFRPRGGL